MNNEPVPVGRTRPISELSAEEIAFRRKQEKDNERQQRNKRNNDSLRGLIFTLYNISEDHRQTTRANSGDETVRVGDMFEIVRQTRENSSACRKARGKRSAEEQS